MRTIFAFCLVLGLILSVNNAFSLTMTKTYTQSVSGADVPSSNETWPVRDVYIDCSIDNTACYLTCSGGGYMACSWNNALNGGTCIGCDEDFFTDGNGQEMFDYAVDQINASVTADTYINNILPTGTTHYFRSITWSYNSSVDVYTMTLTLTEVAP